MAKICPDHKLEAAQDLFDENPDEGIDALQSLLRQYPSDLDVRLSLGRAYLESDEPDEALEHLEFVTERKKTANTLSLLAACYAMLGMEFTAQVTARKASERGAKINPALLDLDVQLPPGVRDKDMFEFERARWQVSTGRFNPALANLKRFNTRYPGFLPSLNTMALALYQAADFESSRQVSLGVLEVDGSNVHALKNLVWLDLITLGQESAQVWREKLLTAPASQPGEFAAKTQALLLLEAWGGALGVVQVFEAFDPGEGRGVPPGIAELMSDYRDEAVRQLGAQSAQQLGQTTRNALERNNAEENVLQDGAQAFKDLEALEAQLTVGREPLITLDDLLPTAFEQRWATPSKHISKTVAEDLRRIPGWLSLAPSQLGFLAAGSIRCIALALLEANPPIPVPVFPLVSTPDSAPDSDSEPVSDPSWFEVLRTVALEGPGLLSGRLALLEVLTDRDLLPANSGILIPGWPHREAPIRLSTNPDDRPAPTGEAMALHSQAVALTQQQKFEQARRLYTRLFQDLPENFMIEFNLAGCEYHQAHLRERGIERIKKVHLEHPNYLQARGSLAGIYREQGDLRTASELLIWPEVDVAGEQDYAQMTAMLGLVWLDQDHDMTQVIKLDALLQAIAPERPVVRLFKQQLVRRVLETMESIRDGLDDWDDEDDDLDGSSTLEDALSRVIDVSRRTSG